MSMVRFAMLCDNCQRRSEEYGSWPSCRDCGEHACTMCDVPGERTEDERNLTLCRECAADNEFLAQAGRRPGAASEKSIAAGFSPSEAQAVKAAMEREQRGREVAEGLRRERGE